MDANELAQEFLSGYHNENTRRNYEKDLERFLAWCEEGKLAPLELRRAEGNRYLSHLLERGFGNQTIHRRLASVRMFFEYALSEELIERNPLQFVKFRWQRGDSETPWLNEDELKALLAAATTTNVPLRDFVLCALGGLSGLRINEIATARIENLTETGGHRVLWVRRKGNKKTKVPIDPRVGSVIDAYLEWLGNPTEGPLVVSVTRYGTPRQPLRPVEKVSVGKRLKKLAAIARVNPTISAHSLRHSFATIALGKGAALHHVQAAMGHANPATTMHYNRDKDNLDNNPTFMVCDELFGSGGGAAAVEAVTRAPIPLPGGEG
jgi:integrase/recombinase XerD